MEIVLPRFRDSKDLCIRLGDYYDDPTVLRYLERLEGGGGSPLAAAAAIVKIGTEATAALGSMKSNVLQALQKVFPSGSTQERVSKEDQDDVHDSAYDMQSEELLEKTDHNISGAKAGAFMDLNPAYSSEQDWTYQIKDSSMKLMGAGVVVGLLTLAGLNYLPGRNVFPATRKELISTGTAADVTSQGNFHTPKALFLYIYKLRNMEMDTDTGHNDTWSIHMGHDNSLQIRTRGPGDMTLEYIRVFLLTVHAYIDMIKHSNV